MMLNDVNFMMYIPHVSILQIIQYIHVNNFIRFKVSLEFRIIAETRTIPRIELWSYLFINLKICEKHEKVQETCILGREK